MQKSVAVLRDIRFLRLPTRRAAPMYGPLFMTLLLLPFSILLLSGFLFPLIRALVHSLTSTTSFGSEYRDVVTDPVFWLVLGRTFLQAAEVSAICVGLGYAIAEMLNLAKPAVRPVLLALVVIPLWSSAVARTYSWVGIFQRGGLVDNIASWFAIPPLQLLFTQFAVIVGMVHVMLPFVVLPLYAVVQRYDLRLTQASLSLGASRLRTLARVKLPILAPQIVASGVGAFILALGFYITPAVLGGPRSQMISNLIAQQVFQRYDIGRGEAISLLLVASTVGLLLATASAGWLYRRVRR
jgi:putative spermidine/putrescine transport system permease protein